MRPPRRPSSFFYHPLDSVLGTPAAIRILRLFSLHQSVMSAPMIAERTGMATAGIHRALKRLVEAQALEAVGDPRRPHYTLRKNNPLIAHLTALFELEAARTDLFMERLRDAANAMSPKPDAVWLVGSVARAEDSATSDVDVALVWGVVHDDPKVFHRAIHAAGEEIGLPMSILSLTSSEVSEHAAANDAWWQNLVADAVPIMGPAPRNLIGG